MAVRSLNRGACPSPRQTVSASLADGLPRAAHQEGHLPEDHCRELVVRDLH